MWLCSADLFEIERAHAAPSPDLAALRYAEDFFALHQAAEAVTVWVRERGARRMRMKATIRRDWSVLVQQIEDNPSGRVSGRK